MAVVHSILQTSNWKLIQIVTVSKCEVSLGIKWLFLMHNNLNFKKIESEEESGKLTRSRPLGTEYKGDDIRLWFSLKDKSDAGLGTKRCHQNPKGH